MTYGLASSGSLFQSYGAYPGSPYDGDLMQQLHKLPGYIHGQHR